MDNVHRRDAEVAEILCVSAVKAPEDLRVSNTKFAIDLVIAGAAASSSLPGKGRQVKWLRA